MCPFLFFLEHANTSKLVLTNSDFKQLLDTFLKQIIFSSKNNQSSFKVYQIRID